MTAAAAVREHPILFSTDMVRAILGGSKTMTRRVVTLPRPLAKRGATLDDAYANGGFLAVRLLDEDCVVHLPCPYGYAGDPVVGQSASLLWVRETWNIGRPAITYGANAGAGFVPMWGGTPKAMTIDGYREHYADHKIAYAASWDGPDAPWWRPSIFMPQWASRITLEITNVRVERLQAIAAADCVAEGIDVPGLGLGPTKDRVIERYCQLWNLLNAKRGYGWDVNPWVWVIEFKRATE